MSEPVIPSGWFRLGLHEILKHGDCFMAGSNPNLNKINHSAGRTPKDFSFISNDGSLIIYYTFIRKQAEPVPEKEWLNP